MDLHASPTAGTRIVNPYKLSTLIAIITLAMIWAYACARTATSNKASPKTKQGYLRKSVFRLGFDLLRKWIFQTPQKAVEVWNAIWPKPKSSLNFRRVV